jgi:alpha-galactosidase
MAELLIMHPTDSEIIANRVSSEIWLDAANSAAEWRSAQPIRFFADWQGKNPDPALETEVRVLWSPTSLYLRFVCRYRELFVFEDSESNGRRDHLWDRDVVEAFLQPDVAAESDRVGADALVRPVERSSTSGEKHRAGGPEAGEDARRSSFYKEFEIAPNGMWIDLDISPSGLADLKSGLTRSVHVDAQRKTWTAVLAIPMRCLTVQFDPKKEWRANFYRVEGKVEPRQYLAWQPTHTPQPNFHVPKAFGRLRFEPGAGA